MSQDTKSSAFVITGCGCNGDRNDDRNNEALESARHVPLKNPVCVLCRFPICDGEKTGAVIGDRDARTYTSFTLAFELPEHNQSSTYADVYAQSCAEPWKLCRHHPCQPCRRGQDAALYHVDCYQMISRHCKPIRLRDIWVISLWSQPTSGSQYPAWSTLSRGFPSNVTPQVDGFAYRLSKLPEELRGIIIRQCPKNQYLRLLMALHRRKLYGPLLDETHVEREIPFTQVVSWGRSKGPKLGCVPSGWVRIRLDDFGIAQVKPFNNETSLVVPEPFYNKRYIVENRKALQNSHVLIKGPFLRIKTARTLNIWETPRPSIGNIAWYDRQNVPVFIRAICLDGVRALTAFCLNGVLHWLHPHYSGEENMDAPHPVREGAPSSEMNPYTPIFFPLADGEVLESLWTRYRGFRGTRKDVVMIFVTNFGRSLVLGKYDHPAHAGIAFGPVQLEIGSHLIVPRYKFNFPDTNFGVLRRSPSRDITELNVPQSLARAVFSPLRPEDPLYLSAAPFSDIEQMTLFYRPGSSGLQYVGIIIEYTDGAVESLGSCYGRTCTEIRSEPTKIQAYHEGGIMNLRLSPATEWRVEILDTHEVHEIRAGETLLWWHDSDGLRMVEAQTRAQPHVTTFITL